MAVAPQLGHFLRRLHAPDVADAAAADALPFDVNHRSDMGTRASLARSQVADVERMRLWRAPARIGRLLDEALELTPPEPPVLVHGDLHFRHALVDGGRLTGIIDWGDVCRADPAVDLSLVWSFLPPAGRAAFLEAYGPVSRAQAVRARVLAVSLCAALAAYGHDQQLVNVEREAVAGLDRIAADLEGDA
jgi:aminoglycoside phosphotransferase (APT) family kinase protein